MNYPKLAAGGIKGRKPTMVQLVFKGKTNSTSGRTAWPSGANLIEEVYPVVFLRLKVHMVRKNIESIWSFESPVFTFTIKVMPAHGAIVVYIRTNLSIFFRVKFSNFPTFFKILNEMPGWHKILSKARLCLRCEFREK